jgi:hypothetical protein
MSSEKTRNLIILVGVFEECRPFICLGGCHIKTRYKGNLLTTVVVDPNDCIYQIAMGVVEVECICSWEWSFNFER